MNTISLWLNILALGLGAWALIALVVVPRYQSRRRARSYRALKAVERTYPEERCACGHLARDHQQRSPADPAYCTPLPSEDCFCTLYRPVTRA